MCTWECIKSSFRFIINLRNLWLTFLSWQDIMNNIFFTTGIFFLLYICQIWGFSFWIGVAGEHCLVSWGGFLWKGKDLWGNKGNLGGEFYVEAGEFSDLRCLMNILWCSPPNDFNDLKVCAILGGFSSTVQQRILRFNLL